MQSRLVFLGLLALVACSANASRLRSQSPNKKAEEVQKLMAHFEAVNKGLNKMLNGPNMAKLKPSLSAFTAELAETLKECKTDKKLNDDQKLEKLHNAQKGVEELMQGLTAQQQALKKEGDQEKESLLMGVLMTHQAAPMKEQLAILADDEFKNLDVSKAMLAKHEDGPLFKQVATYLDKESKGEKRKEAAAPEKPKSKAEAKAEAEAQLTKVEGLLQSNLDHMEKNLETEEMLHKKHNVVLERALEKRLSNATVAKDPKKVAQLKKLFKAMEKKEDRKYQKHHALAQQDAKSLKASIAALKKGDVKAVEGAMKALKDSLQARQAEMGDFLHFLQLSTVSLRIKTTSVQSFLQLSAQDCPYCAAQCLEKCHGEGHSYVDCMGSCADAGKR